MDRLPTPSAIHLSALYLSPCLPSPPELSIDVLPHHVEIRHIPGGHAGNRRVAAEGGGGVGLVDPGIGCCGEQRLQALIDAQNIRNPFQRVLAQGAHGAALPAPQGGAAMEAQQVHLLSLSQVPGRGDAEKCPQGGAGQFLSLGGGHHHSHPLRLVPRAA
jgi:hypothetical protein